ncbi:putative lrr receptor-like serine/threonine-protein kinase rkf3 [Quercus suber]|uniref:Lrr receptor-like serine/threonine-protein kinase rkf3 n=1 Tax=Quercus suber TaxID=58331 RepID=A0AAW0JK78_QUESU
MTDSLLSWVESKWMEGKYEQAYDFAKMVKQYDLYFEGVERYYIAMCIIHTGKFKKNKLGYIDLYALLGFTASDNHQSLIKSLIASSNKGIVIWRSGCIPTSFPLQWRMRLSNSWTRRGRSWVTSSIKKTMTDEQKPKEVVRVGMKRCAPLTATAHDDKMGQMSVNSSFFLGASDGNELDCASNPYVYAAAFANQFGLTDSGIVKCLFTLAFSSDSGKTKENEILYWGVLVGCIISIFGVVLVIWVCWRRHKKCRERK